MSGRVVSSQLSVVSCVRHTDQQRTTDHGPRTGISLTEVLIAMGILTLGLLGVAAIFPVGGHYIKTAEISDRGSAIAQSVMSDIVAKGMLNPAAWYTMIPNPTSATPTAPNFRFRADGVPGLFPSSTFARPFGAALSEGLSRTQDRVLLAKQFGNAYVLDPIGVAATVRPNTVSNFNAIGYPFPFNARMVPVNTANYPSTAWDPWRAGTSNDLTWPIRRMTFLEPTTGRQMEERMAEHYFRGSDDLTTDLPDRDDRPAAQNWEIADVPGVGNTPLARGWQGDYSWIVTIAPTTTAARDGIVRSPESYSYDISVVVFYKRVLPSASDAGTPDAMIQAATSERVVKARVLSKGPNGGELLLDDYANSGTSFEQLKTGQWVMLCGPHTASTTSEPRFAMNWYQVMAVDKMGFIETQRGVALRGPEWPWEPATTPAGIGDNNHLSNSLCVAICRGAVAVHQKTLRLEGARGSAWTSGWGSAWGVTVSPDGVPPPYKFGL